MQTHRLAIELNSSADLSKSTPDGDEDLFLRHGPSSRRPIRVTVEGRLAAATISMDGRQGLPHRRHSASAPARAHSGHLLNTRRSPFDNTESRLTTYERHVVGHYRLGETLEGARTNLFGYNASP